MKHKTVITNTQTVPTAGESVKQVTLSSLNLKVIGFDDNSQHRTIAVLIQRKMTTKK